MSIITTLVVGGCKSGKSKYALDLADKLIYEPNDKPDNKLIRGKKIFVATSVPADSEMQERVETHKKERGKNWLTIEEPISIASVIKKHSRESDVILIDCLTLWISNLLYKNYDKEKILEYVQELIKSVQNAECSVIIVSNEVGTGIVPENKLARLFRDIAGITNQAVAAAVTDVVWTIAGIPVNIKK